MLWLTDVLRTMNLRRTTENIKYALSAILPSMVIISRYWSLRLSDIYIRNLINQEFILMKSQSCSTLFMGNKVCAHAIFVSINKSNG